MVNTLKTALRAAWEPTAGEDDIEAAGVRKGDEPHAGEVHLALLTQPLERSWAQRRAQGRQGGREGAG